MASKLPVRGGRGGRLGGREVAGELQITTESFISREDTRGRARQRPRQGINSLCMEKCLSPSLRCSPWVFTRAAETFRRPLSQGQRPPSGPADKGTLTSRRFSPDPGLIGSRYACPGKASPRELPSRSPRSRIVFVEPLGPFLLRRSTPKFRSGILAGTIVLAPLRARRLVFIPS